MKYLKRFESVALEEPKVKKYNDYIDLPPIKNDDDGGGDGDDDQNYAYLFEWLGYWKDGEYPPMFSEIWRDEVYRKRLDSYKDTEAFKFYSKLWYEHMYDHPQLKKQIEKDITDYINSYNSSVYELDRKRAIDKEIEDIMNEHEVELGGKKVTYKLEKPQKGYVNRFIKSGESEEEANQLLFSLKGIEGVYDPDNLPEGREAWDKWMKTSYVPFLEEYIEPYIEKNGWRAWSI
jgi:hypothetical protein